MLARRLSECMASVPLEPIVEVFEALPAWQATTLLLGLPPTRPLARDPVMTVLTGFPGFLGAALIERLLARGERVICFVQEKYQTVAERLDLEPASPPYRSHPTSFVAPNTRQTLAGTDVSCPLLSGNLEELLAFMRAPGAARLGDDLNACVFPARQRCRWSV